MRYVWNILLKGMAAVLPVGLTLYLIYWLGVSIEGLLRPVIVAVIPETYYLPGLGLIAGLGLLFLAGLAVNAWIIQRVLRLGEGLLERIPLVKSIYGALRDFTDYFSTASERKNLQNVVMIRFGELRLIGFLTVDDPQRMPGMPGSADDMVAVYLPMSYQIGGYTVYLPRSRVQELDMRFEDAMRMVLTAGLSKSN